MSFRKTPVTNYAYACTRVRARKKFLIKPEEYTRLASMDLASVARYMGESYYKKEIERLSSSLAGTELIESATYLNLASTYEQIIRFLKGEAKHILQSYLAELDLKNLKTIIRGKFHNANSQDIKADLIPGGRLAEELAESLLSAKSVQGVIERLQGDPYYAPLKHVMEKEPELYSLIHLEDALDIAYYRFLLGSLTGTGTSTSLFRDFVRREIDLKNVITLLRVKMDEELLGRGLEMGEIFIPGGLEMDRRDLAAMHASQGLRQLCGMMEEYSFYQALAPHLEELLVNKSLDIAINALEKHHRAGIAGFASRYPLSILPIIHYLLLKNQEVENLRIIARGKEKGLSPEVIKNLVVT